MMTMLTAGMAGCAKTGTTGTPTPVTYVSLMNMASYSPPVDVYLNGTISSAAGGIPAGSVSSQYGPLHPGIYDFQFKKTGSDSLMAEIPSSNYDTTAYYTLILYNTAGGGPVNAAKITDDFSTVSNTAVNYRFFNLGPDAPKVDFYLNGSLAQPGRAYADNIYNPNYNNFLQTSSAISSLLVKKANTDSVLASLSPSQSLTGGVYTIYLAETKNGPANNFALNVLQASY
jgi:hypothetical protein